MPPVCAVSCSMSTLSSNDVVPKTSKKCDVKLVLSLSIELLSMSCKTGDRPKN